MPALGIVPPCGICPKCAKRKALYAAAFNSLGAAQEGLFREWVSYWVSAGVPRDSLLGSDPDLYVAGVVERVAQELDQEGQV